MEKHDAMPAPRATMAGEVMQRRRQGSMGDREKDSVAGGYEGAPESLRARGTPHGFLAATTDNANDHRIWERDSLASFQAI